MKKLYLVLGVALVVSVMLCIAWEPMPFEERLVRVQVEHASPELTKALQDEPIEVQATVLDYEDDALLLHKALAALIRYPEMARAVLPLYGAEPEFKEILKKYGDAVLPPIAYFLENEVRTVAVMAYTAEKVQKAKEAAASLWNKGDDDLPEVVETAAVASEESDTMAGEANAKEGLTPEERGWYAINFIASEGYDFLGQFIVHADGEPKWIQSERVLEGVNGFFASGIRTLETKTQLEQDITAGDVGWAAVDALAVVGAVKLLRVGKAAAATGKPLKASTKVAAITSRVARTGRLAGKFMKYGKWPAMILTGYVVVSHPGLISDILADIANFMGLPAWLVQFVGWTLILLPVFYVASWVMRLLVRPALFILTVLTRLLMRFSRGSRSGMREAAVVVA